MAAISLEVNPSVEEAAVGAAVGTAVGTAVGAAAAVGAHAAVATGAAVGGGGTPSQMRPVLGGQPAGQTAVRLVASEDIAIAVHS